MTDPHPANFEIEIDRERLRKYLRAKWLLAWMAPLTFYGTVFGLVPACKHLDSGEVNSVREFLAIVMMPVGIGSLIGMTIGLLCYLLLSHWIAARIARSLRVSIEGTFLRIRQSAWARTDRKLHFRSLVDYAVVQGILMKLSGIESLQVTTIGGRQSSLFIHGVRDCTRVRDLLAEIDSQRENA